MANKLGLKCKGFEELMRKLDEVGGSPAMKRGVDSALKKSKDHVNKQLNSIMTPGNMPAGGKYSTGETKEHINTDMSVDWQGMKGSIKVGFDLQGAGLRSIFLMHGTPKMSPMPGLKDAIYGSKTQKELAKLQAEEINKVIKRIMEG